MMGIVPLVVDRPLLQQANALLALSRNILGVAGPAVAGLLVVTVGPAWALALDALTYAIAVVCLSRVRLSTDDRRARQSILGELREGWSQFVSRQWVWVIVLVFGINNAIGYGTVFVLGPLIAKTTSLGEAGWGLGLSAEAVGTVVMTLVMLRVHPARPLLAAQVGAAFIAVPMIMLGLAPSVVPMVIAFFVGGLALEIFGVTWNTALHEHIPVEVLSRVSSYDMLGSFVAMPIGTFVYGWLATRYELGTLALVSGIGYVLVALAALLSPSVRHLRRVAH